MPSGRLPSGRHGRYTDIHLYDALSRRAGTLNRAQILFDTHVKTHNRLQNRRESLKKMTTVSPHHNTGLFTLCGCFTLLTVAISAAVFLLQLPSVHASLEALIGLVSQQIENAFPHISPAR